MRGSVYSVNVGTVRTIQYRGRTIRTGIFKNPVAGRVLVNGVNLQGDAQADRKVHGGTDMAVYAYTMEDYAWWQGDLGRAISPGEFGENLTTTRIDVNGAVVGERWRVGTALLQVTIPRLPCYKLAMKMNDPRFVKRFAAALRTGAYLKIVEEGDVGTGDPIEVVSRPTHQVTIAKMARIFLFERERLSELIVPELPLSWRDAILAER